MYYKRKYKKYKDKYKYLQKQFENKIHYLIITVGPTGSGKPNLINRTTSMLKF
jgi:ABC-type lipoprotein export system ATPase subunit